jgi:hypothetical protein
MCKVASGGSCLENYTDDETPFEDYKLVDIHTRMAIEHQKDNATKYNRAIQSKE